MSQSTLLREFSLSSQVSAKEEAIAKCIKRRKHITVLGGGAWAAAVAKVAAENAVRTAELEDEVVLHVREEAMDRRNLSEIINATHEDVRHLPGVTLPENVVAVADLAVAVREADILLFCMPLKELP